MKDFNADFAMIAKDIMQKIDCPHFEDNSWDSWWEKRNLLGIDDKKFFWQCELTVKFCFSVLSPNQFVYWGFAKQNNLIMSYELEQVYIDSYNQELLSLEENQFLYKIQSYLSQQFGLIYRDATISSVCKNEDINRKQPSINDLAREFRKRMGWKPMEEDKIEEDVFARYKFENHYCCDILVSLKKIRSESSSSY